MNEFKGKSLTVTDEHLLLLKRTYITWDPCEYGAPEINPKRPYGNGDVAQDIYEILGWPIGCQDCGVEYDDERARSIHVEMEAVVKVALHNVGEDIRGEWRNASDYGDNWERVG